MTDLSLSAQTVVTLDAAGAGTASITPDTSPGPAYWHVTELVLLSTRPGAAPIPRGVVYLDQALQGTTYDASFNTGSCDLSMQRGQTLFVHFSGGLLGDEITVAVIGTKSTVPI